MRLSLSVTLLSFLVGGCGQPPPSAETTSALGFSALAQNQKNPRRLTVVAGMAAWIADDGVWSASPGAGPFQLSTDTSAYDLTMNASWAYWRRNDPPSYTSVSIWRAPIGGGPAEQLATVPANASENWTDLVGSIAIDTTSIYFDVKDPPIAGSLSTASLYSAPLGGGAATLLATVVTPDNQPEGGIALDAASIYWASSNGSSGSVVTLPKSGGPAVTLVTTTRADLPIEIQLDGGYLYFGDSSQVARVPVGGGAPQQLVAASDIPFAVANGTFYWVVSPMIRAASTASLPIINSSIVGWDPNPAPNDTINALALWNGNLYWASSDGTVQFKSASTTCSPRGCDGVSCGSVATGCGYNISCGCNSGAVCVSSSSTCCQPLTACPAGACGHVSNGCGGTIVCPPCGCTPSCAGKRCGASNGCGGTCWGYCRTHFSCTDDGDGLKYCAYSN